MFATYPYWDGLAMAPGCDAVFQALGAAQRWRDAGEELLAGPFSEEAMLAGSAIDRREDFIRDEALADPTPSVSNDFESEVAYLRTLIPILRSRFEHLLAGLPWEPLAFPVEGITDFEIHSDSTLLGPGSSIGANPTSTVAVSVNTADPMGGDQDLLMSFEYVNDAESWQQWSSYLVPLSGGENDLTTLTGIRMMARSDQVRTLRLNVDTPHAASDNEFTRYGWDIPLTDQATQVEVLFADTALAVWRIDQQVNPGYTVDEGLATARGLVFEPQCVGRDANGMLPDGTTDDGFIQLDDIEFF